MQQQQEPSLRDKFNAYVGRTYTLSGVMAAITLPLLNWHFGERFLAVNGTAAWIIVGCMAIAGEQPSPWIGLYWLFLTCALARRKVETKRDLATNRFQHSLYWGYPWFAAKLGFAREERGGQVFNGLLALGTGWALTWFDYGLGVVIAASGSGVLTMLFFENRVIARRERNMRDAQIEAEWTAERFGRNQRR